MVRPSRFLRALVVATGSAALGLGLAMAPAPSAGAFPAEPDPAPVAKSAARNATKDAAAGRARKAAAAEKDTSPLGVTMTGLSPSYLPKQGNVVVRGEVTNRTDETWTAINLYAVLGNQLPAMRTAADLAAAMEVPVDASVGERIVQEGETGTVIAELAPGETKPYFVRVPASALVVPTGGVYWFGVHALGVSDSTPQDSFADGRARTFLPYVPPRVQTPVATALVLPLVRPLPFNPDGSIDVDEETLTALGSSGRLRRLLDLGAAAGSTPLTWVIDPALVEGVAALAAGNPPRSLTPTPPAGDATDAPSDAPTETPEAEPPADTPASRAAAAWLSALPAALTGDEVLTLPYGNVDVPAALQQGSALYPVALAKRSAALDGLGVTTAPVIAAPGGFLDAEAIRSADRDTQVLVSDRVFGESAPSIAALDGHRMVVASSGAATGSPGPGPALTMVGLRQRILAEAAVRALQTDQPPLTVVLPTGWDLDSAAEFFAGLDVGWLDLRTLSGLQATSMPTAVTDDELVYPPAQRRAQLDGVTFSAAERLVTSAETLQSVLGENFSIAGAVTQEALSGISYAARADQYADRAALDRSREWIEERLGKVTISASAGVTLSSASGSFLVTVSNDLDEPVTVGVTAESDSELTITAPDPVLLGPGSRTNVLLQVSTTSNRVHNVTLMVTDVNGVPLGGTDELPIRSTQVSDVIWVIMGSGVGLLFLAIAIRLVRRVRTARRGARVEIP